jgi:hypothetical protein
MAINNTSLFTELENKMKILMVLTSHDQLGDTGKKPVSGWKNLQHLTIRLPMRAQTSFWHHLPADNRH